MKLNINLVNPEKDLVFPENAINVSGNTSTLVCIENNKWVLASSEKAVMKVGTIIEIEPNIVRIDLNSGNIFSITVTKNITIEIVNDDLINFNHGYQVILRIKNGGNFIVTYPESFKFARGKIPTLTKDGYDELNCLVLPTKRIHVNTLLGIK